MQKQHQPVVEDRPQLIGPALSPLKDLVKTNVNRTYKWRVLMLRKLIKVMSENSQTIAQAAKKDLNRNSFLQATFQMNPIIQEIQDLIDNLPKWMKAQSVSCPMILGPGSCQIIREPLGTCLVIGSWNFPFWTIFGPMASAFAAGNNILVKPSEMAPNCSNLTKELLRKYYDESEVGCVEGGVEVAKAITQAEVDAIIFTGSPMKGRLVAAAASKHLTPCILQLGGKSPAIIDKSANISYTANKLAFSKFYNCGQVCITIDYVLVHEDIYDEFMKALIDAIKRQYGQNCLLNEDMGKIINSFHTKRIAGLLRQDHGGEVVYGGKVYEKEEFIEPTIIVNPSLESNLMQEEIFGPILPVLKWRQIDSVIDMIKEREKPLTLYYFGSVNSSIQKRLQNELSSGSMAVNEFLFQANNPNLPFGGVGNSGYGKYHGLEGFRALTNAKSMLVKPVINLPPFNKILPPFDNARQRLLRPLVKAMGRSTQKQMVMKLLLLIFIILMIVLWARGSLPKIVSSFVMFGKLVWSAFKQSFLGCSGNS